MIDSIYTKQMTPQQTAWFYAEYALASKDELVGLLFALLLGGFGIHKFYLGRNTAGALYLLFFWTGIPHILGFIDCFFMPRNVRAYNAAQASYIATQILASPPPGEPPPQTSTAAHLQPTHAIPALQPCAACGQPSNAAAPFCPNCGAWRSRQIAT